MPVFLASQLEKLAYEIFRAVGAPPDVAQHVASSLVLSNLMGHDSHGVLRIPSYLEAIEQGAIVPDARPTVARETETTAVVDGNWGFGQITADFATRLALIKARDVQVAAVGMVRCNHIGRLGEYTEHAAREGMLAIMFGATFGGRVVAPYGGAARALGTNPLSVAMPGGEMPIVADMATSMAAEGKLRVARAKNEPVAPGIILDKHGNPSTDAKDFYDGGMLLPFGGHKGYALAIAAELAAKYLPGGEAFATGATSFGNLIVLLNVSAFRPLDQYLEAVAARLREIKSVPPAPGFREVMLPGEPERRTLLQRKESGIPVPEDTCLKLTEIAVRLGVSMPSPVEGDAK